MYIGKVAKLPVAGASEVKQRGQQAVMTSSRAGQLSLQWRTRLLQHPTENQQLQCCLHGDALHLYCSGLLQRALRLRVLRCLLARHVLSHLISVCVYGFSLEIFPLPKYWFMPRQPLNLRLQ